MKYAAAGSYTFPAPRHQFFKQKLADQFVLYCKGLGRPRPRKNVTREASAERAKREIELLQIVIYQNWPVRRLKYGPGGEKIARHICKLEQEPWPFGDPWQIKWLERFGSGDYVIWLKELGVEEAICSCEFSIRNPEYPPQVPPDELDLSDPANKSYIQELKGRGIVIPGEQDEEQQEEEEMVAAVNTELVGKVVDQAQDIGEMKATITHLTNKANEPAPTPATSEPDPIVTKAYDAALGMVKDTAKEQREAMGKGLDIAQVVNAVKTITEMSRPDNGFTKVLTDQNKLLQEELVEMRRKTEDRLAEENRFLRERVMAPAQQTVVNPSSSQPRSFLEEFKQAKELIDTVTGNNADKENATEPWWTRLLSPQVFDVAGKVVLGAVNLFGMYAANVAHNNAVARTGQGVPQAIPQPVPQPQPQTQPVSTDPNVTAALAANVPPEVIQYLQKITEPLVTQFLEPECSGYMFAEWVMTRGTNVFNPAGRQDYEQLKGIGYEGIVTMLKSWPPIWNILGTAPASKVEKFIREFLGYDEYTAAQEAAPNGVAAMPLR
jgi:hypothetical protein